ncbi:2Fe-2S iron-sulfur cluster-binding protein [Algoriphagus sp. NG3]|uniref:2Fe-2S iron-sulfur cluster-binding protein n=1 Tax=Algoriphagus sp. NG3 TaxID=3097546 RepID=UPI002A807FC3|nr:2Fe-2S iron-sulfur cluster-binding protein [Algoriphagus sp. NG3]WPR75301.1 2Fe-2S iron-sulfur cluster-binding protein [Algoriphagus sp. NG3]
MPHIVIENLFNLRINSTSVHRKVIEIIHENNIDWMHACGKKGRCTTCKIIMVSGEGHLSPPTKAELDFLKQGRLKEGERLSCQAELSEGEIVVRVGQSNKFPHIEYSE